jgi:mannose-6-phosphate isomerase-like protein (cupin superfamily)
MFNGGWQTWRATVYDPAADRLSADGKPVACWPPPKDTLKSCGGVMEISNEEMLKRIARFAQLMPMDYKQMPGGDAVPRSMQGFSVIGHVTKAAPAIPGDHGFTVAFNKVQPGKGAPLHSHSVVEVFVPLSGRWKFFWGEDGTGEAELGPWDTISFPAGLMEGFRNIGDEEGTLLVVLGGPDVGEITFRKNEEQPTA